MDTVYGTKKYFQSLSGGSDIYRSSTCRAVANDYSSYQNTYGRKSAMGPYSHISKQMSYPADFSTSSQYGYNAWGMWRDTRNLTPSIYSTKSRQSVKSFSIILSTAAFIVILAVLSIAGLAFYFSTFKSNLEEPVMVFEGSFRIIKGDMFVTGMKFKNTSIHRQKSDFYKRFVERSLLDSSLQPTRIDILGFGEGPLVNVFFRIFLDIRRIPQNIRSMEEHIQLAIVSETKAHKSLYKSLKIESEVVEVRRITDESILRSAMFSRESGPSASQTHFEKRLNKKHGTNDKSNSKTLTTQKSKIKPIDSEPEVDVENAPIIQGSFEGSFEITKTDADISHMKVTPTKSVSHLIKTTKSSTVMNSSIPENSMAVTDIVIEETKISSSTTEKKSISTEKPITTTVKSVEAYTKKSAQDDQKKYVNDHNLPKLDENLFTSAPIYDNEPWRPIKSPAVHHSASNGEKLKPDAMDVEIMPRNKLKIASTITETPSEKILYHSFTHQDFDSGDFAIEKLGSSDVKPHPLPVSLLDDVKLHDFKSYEASQSENDDIYNNFNFSEIIDMFEHIGGGVIVKKHENRTEIEQEKPAVSVFDITSPSSKTAIEISTSTEKHLVTSPYIIETTKLDEISTQLSDKVVNISESSKNAQSKNDTELKLESRNESGETMKIDFLNIKEHILKNAEKSSTSTEKVTSSNFVTSRTTASQPTKTVPVVKKTTVGLIDASMLFPSHTKWEYINGSSNGAQFPPPVQTKKIFNHTLQAWIVENAEKDDHQTIKDVQSKRNTSADIQNISAIFDTLASKLGISPSIQTKVPPFLGFSYNKIKNAQNITSQTRQKYRTPLNRTSITKFTSSIPLNLSTILPILTTPKSVNTTTEVVVGEAEVEVIDPEKYEEILSSHSMGYSTSSVPTLVTLLPAKSNSGLRNSFRPPLKIGQSRKFGQNLRYRDTIVKSGIHVSA